MGIQEVLEKLEGREKESWSYGFFFLGIFFIDDDDDDDNNYDDDDADVLLFISDFSFFFQEEKKMRENCEEKRGGCIDLEKAKKKGKKWNEMETTHLSS